MYCVKCHNSPSATNGNFALSVSFGGAYEELTQNTANHAAPDTTCDEAYVVLNDPDASLLYQKITGVGIPTGCGVQMPKGGPYLSTQDMETIKDWINNNEQP
jgi:hypothetical protein